MPNAALIRGFDVKGKSKLLSADEQFDDVIKQFNAIATEGKYPAGIERAELWLSNKGIARSCSKSDFEAQEKARIDSAKLRAEQEKSKPGATAGKTETNTMKTNKIAATVAAIIAFAAVLLTTAPQAQAQYSTYSYQEVLAGGTNNLPVGTATQLWTTCTMDVRKQENVGIYISAKSAGTNLEASSRLTFRFQYSLDGSTWGTNGLDTVYPLSMTFLPNTTTSNTVSSLVTNVNCQGIGYMRLRAAETTNGLAHFTNLTFGYSIKR